MADLYAAIGDDAVNRIIEALHVQAPYLFNYVAPSIKLQTDPQGNLTGIVDNWLTCTDVFPDPPPGVPRYRRIPPFQLPGVAVKLPCSIQVIQVKVDFHPSDQVTLPEELLPPLREQSFAIQAVVQFGLACVPPTAVSVPGVRTFGDSIPVTQFPVLPVDSLTCFVLQIFAVGHLTVDASGALQQVKMEVDGLEILQIEPSGLEEAVECYLTAMLKGAILPGIVLGIQTIPINTLGLTAVTPTLTAGLPNNPAVEDNELRVWLDLAFS
jgi:hypothetical protein